VLAGPSSRSPAGSARESRGSPSDRVLGTELSGAIPPLGVLEWIPLRRKPLHRRIKDRPAEAGHSRGTGA
jgi:hypothetical protein